MLQNFVLGAELAKKGNFHIANISMLFKDYPLIEGTDYLKYGGVTLLSTKSLGFPKYINELLRTSDGFTDLSDYIPWVYFADTLENNTNLIKDKYVKVKIEGKQFVKIKDNKFSDILLNDDLIKSVVDNSEIKDLINENYIKGHIKISTKKALCWY